VIKMLIDILKEKISLAFKECGYDEEIRVIKSNRPDLCDYQCDDVFKLAKINKEKPALVGEKIVKKINNFKNFNDYFKEVTFAEPGFINIVVSDKLINEALNKMVNNEKFNLNLHSSSLIKYSIYKLFFSSNISFVSTSISSI